MLVVADLSILRRAGLQRRYFFLATFMAVAVSVLFSGKRSPPLPLSWERGHLGRYFSGRDVRAPRGE